MLFSYNWLQSFFPAKCGQGKKFPTPKKLAEILTMRSFETAFSKRNNDFILDIDVLPNRTHDCLSHMGVAKEISALFNIPLRKTAEPKPDLLKMEREEKFLTVDVKEPKLCRRYITGIMTDIKVGSSPIWMQERLIAVGQKPINNIIDAVNYIMFDVGQPLHAFDADKLAAGDKGQAKIIVRRAKKGEKITTLDNMEVGLDENILVIADSKDPLAIAGIKGGKKAEIDSKTKNIVIESANFEPVNIRQTSQKIGLRTGASIGFENEISPVLAETAINMAMALIQKTAGGKIVEEKIDFYPVKLRPARVVFNVSDVSGILGVSISEKEILATLNQLGIKTKRAQKGVIIATGPAERLDLNIKEDVIEEIARIYGYQKIFAKVPEGFLIPPPRNDIYFYENIIRDLMSGAGFSEVYNYSFVKTGEVQIKNPIADDKKFLRANLLDGLRDNAFYNLKYFDQVRIFEIGKIFEKARNEIKEKKALAGLIAHKKSREKEDFYEIKGSLEALFAHLGITDFWFDDLPAETLAKAGSPPIFAEIKIEKEGIGFISCNAFELDLEKLIILANEEMEYRPVSRYPAMVRDIAVLVSPKTKVVEVADIIENTAGILLIDTDLFDIYDGKFAGERKSFAFHLVFQSSEKTLTDKEVNAVMDKIIKALEERPDWEVRK